MTTIVKTLMVSEIASVIEPTIFEKNTAPIFQFAHVAYLFRVDEVERENNIYTVDIEMHFVNFLFLQFLSKFSKLAE